MQEEQKTPAPDAAKNLTGALWAASISFVAIIILTVLLFVIPNPSKNSADSTATSTAEVTETNAPTTPKPVSTDSQSAYPAAGSRFMQNGVYVTVIHFNGKAFNPASVTITHGEEVRFINTSNLTMDIGNQTPNASSPGYSALNQAMAKGKGGTYQVGLTDIGVWAYANLTSTPQIKGVITVK